MSHIAAEFEVAPRRGVRVFAVDETGLRFHVDGRSADLADIAVDRRDLVIRLARAAEDC